jgi:hypothetical protein
MGDRPPFPQFDPDDPDLTHPAGLIRALRSRHEAAEAELPHAVLIHDPETDTTTAHGPYPTAHAALLAGEAMTADFNRPGHNDGAPITATVVRILAPAPDGPPRAEPDR